jgi:triphosphatase
VNELELKLAIARQGGRDALLSLQALGEPVEFDHLLATYFDTADRLLAKNGISLRIRREGGHLIQTIKSSGKSGSGLFDRREDVRKVRRMVPALEPGDPVASLLAGKGAELGPVFKVEVDRTIWRLADGDCRIEVALDLGFASAGEARRPISEIELELRSGNVACLFELADKLSRSIPVRLGILTKAERGWMLLEPERTSFKAEKLRLAKDMTSAAAFQLICQSCIRQFRLNEELLLASGGSEAVHQARVAIRRLRSAFTAFRKLIRDDATTALLNRDLRWLAGELGAVRDIDVLQEMAPTDQLKARLAELRGQAYAHLREILDTERSRMLFVDIARWLNQGAWLHLPESEKHRVRPLRDHAERVLARLFGKVRRGGYALFGRDLDEGRHELRKSAKKLRYALEFLGSQFSSRTEQVALKSFLSSLETLQEVLGRLNDLSSAGNAVKRLNLEDEWTGWPVSGHEKSELLAAAQGAHASLMGAHRFWR